MNADDQSNLETPPPEESSNRTFLVVAGIFGGIILLTLACVAGYLVFFRPAATAASQAAIATRNATNLQVVQALTTTAQAAQILPTATLTPPPTQTPVVAQATATAVPPTTTSDPATATVAAALTQAAQAQLTHVPTSTALPKTGFADQYGAPGLVIMGLALVGVIFLARRLRVGTQ